MLRYFGRLRYTGSNPWLSACSSMGFAASGCRGGPQYPASMMHSHQRLQHAWPSNFVYSRTHIVVGRRPATVLCQEALTLRQVATRAILSQCQRHLCGLPSRQFTTSSCLRAIRKARPALPVEAVEGPKRYAFRQKKWHKKIDKKRPNMPPREPLPPKHPARIVQSERCEQPHLSLLGSSYFYILSHRHHQRLVISPPPWWAGHAQLQDGIIDAE